MSGLLNSNLDFYKRVVDNEKLRENVKVGLFSLLYDEFGKIKEIWGDLICEQTHKCLKEWNATIEACWVKGNKLF